MVTVVATSRLTLSVPTVPLDAGQYVFVGRGRAGAEKLPCRPHRERAQLTTGVYAEGYGEILGPQFTSVEDGAGWLRFFGGT
jgi:hypothetical protein